MERFDRITTNSSPFWLNFALDRNWVCSKRTVYERVLDEIGNAIKKSENIAGDLEELPTDLIDRIIDDETQVIEYLLGTAFVLCQAYITEVISIVKSFHRFASSQQISLTTTTDEKQNILKFGHDGNSSSPAELIDAFANYFKHRDEWSANWNKLSKKQKETARIIQLVGAEPGSSGNLRQGSVALGNPDFIETGIFLDKLEQWYLDLTDAYHTEFKKLLT